MGGGSKRNILVAVDGSPHSELAFERAVGIAKESGEELFIVHVIPEPRTGVLAEYGTRHGGMTIVKTFLASAEKVAVGWVKELETKAKKEGVNAKGEILWELGKSPVQLITEYAKKNDVDVIVMGTRGRGGFKRLLLGSVASGVVAHAHCTVMVVR